MHIYRQTHADITCTNTHLHEHMQTSPEINKCYTNIQAHHMHMGSHTMQMKPYHPHIWLSLISVSRLPSTPPTPRHRPSGPPSHHRSCCNQTSKPQGPLLKCRVLFQSPLSGLSSCFLVPRGLQTSPALRALGSGSLHPSEANGSPELRFPQFSSF